MSVPDVSGSCIANLEVESLLHRSPTFHGDTIYAETHVLEATPSQVEGRPGHRDRGDQGLQPARRRGVLLPAQAHGVEARRRAPSGAGPIPTTSGTESPPVPVARARRFGQRVLDWGAGHRRDLPWRRTRDPWHILVSEVMLQQTQVERVVPHYERFTRAFPDPAACAAAGPAEVVRLWSGLGYNRRALNLQRSAVALVEEHGGALPADDAGLRALPGIGAYTARGRALVRLRPGRGRGRHQCRAGAGPLRRGPGSERPRGVAPG